MKTIMFVECGSSGYGGSFHSLYHTVVNLNPEKYRSVVVFLNKTFFYEKLTESGIRCYYLNDPIYKNCYTYKKFLLLKLNGFVLRYLSSMSVLVQYIIHLKTIHDMESIIRKECVDLIHLNNQLSLNYMGVFVAKSLSIPCVSHLRTFNSYGLNGSKISYAKKIKIKYIAISEKIKRHWVEKGLESKKVDVIYNVYQPVENGGLQNIDVAAMSEYDGFKIIFVGRIIECKGIPFLLESFKQVLDNDIRARLFLVGDGVDMKMIRGYVKTLGIEPYAVFMGYQENPGQFISIADLLILPSKEEGFGRVLLEAMDVGTPVIGTRIGGIPEVIEHGVNGLLVDYGDIEALKKSIIEIQEDKLLRKKLIQGGYETINSKFCVETYQGKLENVYDTLLDVSK